MYRKYITAEEIMTTEAKWSDFASMDGAKTIAAANQLGYRPNAIARSLIGGKTDLIAVIVAENDSIHNKLLVERLGGRIGFETEIGKGSTFYFDLAIASDDA